MLKLRRDSAARGLVAGGEHKKHRGKGLEC